MSIRPLLRVVQPLYDQSRSLVPIGGNKSDLVGCMLDSGRATLQFYL